MCHGSEAEKFGLGGMARQEENVMIFLGKKVLVVIENLFSKQKIQSLFISRYLIWI